MRDPRRLRAHGLTVVPPPGWSAQLGLRAADPGETSQPILHAATFPLPARRGDFGSGVTPRMGRDDVFVAMLEFSAAARGTALFASQGLPRPGPDDFSPNQLQRTLSGQAGFQRFFTWNARPFCLYVVLGHYGRRAVLSARVHELLDAIAADRALLETSAPP